MAKTAILRAPDDERCAIWHDPRIDSTHIQTTIHTITGSILNLAMKRTGIKRTRDCISIYFNTGWYLQIYPTLYFK